MASTKNLFMRKIMARKRRAKGDDVQETAPSLQDVTSSSSPRSSMAVRPKDTNELRKMRSNDQLLILTNELAIGVCQLLLSEHKVYAKDQLISAWNPGTKQKASTKVVIQDASKNFMKTLPSRYILGIDSPAEIMSHMIFLAIVKMDPAKAVVHISRKDSIPTQLTFYTGSSGMSNLKLITIVCTHTIGLLNLVTGFLVSGGSEILDCDYLLSSDKIMLVSF